MPGPAKTWGGNLVDAVKNGFVEEETIDEKVKRILNVVKFTNRFNKKRVAEKSIDKKSHRELIKKTATEGMVLLKNEEVLPFDKTKISKIALIGPNVKDSQIIGGGSAGLKPHYEVHPFEGISKFLKEEKVKINYAKGLTLPKYKQFFSKTDATDNTRPVAPIVYLTLGDMFNNAPGFFTSVNLSIPENSTWESKIFK